ncbi:lymphocyte antigen 6B-like [Carassius auratus]|uniref:Lymphocyte antigen 6B-like n=1 Tax=Carassius auratus TaxID=7957 RepID=A0A6P6NBH3_CARAU|nr:lymphocyte antigen 6B-like [Carassius auratus]XP_052444359.1 lymphocyte antigen 6B-like [Carassius gibelio]
MYLQISVFLLFSLFTAGHSLRCYECMSLTGSCTNQNATTCPSGSTKCMTMTTVAEVGPIKMTSTSKMCSPSCDPGTQQIAIGSVTTQCCDTDLCNAADGMYKASFLLLLSPLLFYFLVQ